MQIELRDPSLSAEEQKELDRWLAAKKGTIGGSSAADAIGIGRSGSRLRLWAEMTGALPREDISAKQAVHWGTRLEGVVTRELEERVLGYNVYANIAPSLEEADRIGTYHFKPEGQPLYRSKARPWQTFSPDGFASVEGINDFGIIETKTTGLHSASDWGDDPPEWAILQCLHGMAVTGLSWAVIPVLIGGQNFRVYRVERDDELIECINNREKQFIDYVQRKEPPPVDDDHADTLRTLKLLHPKDNGKRIALPREAAQWDRELQQLKLEKAGVRARIEALESRFRAALGDSTFGELEGAAPGFEVEYSLKTTDRKGHTVSATSFRSLRRKETEKK